MTGSRNVSTSGNLDIKLDIKSYDLDYSIVNRSIMLSIKIDSFKLMASMKSVYAIQTIVYKSRPLHRSY